MAGSPWGRSSPLGTGPVPTLAPVLPASGSRTVGAPRQTLRTGWRERRVREGRDAGMQRAARRPASLPASVSPPALRAPPAARPWSKPRTYAEHWARAAHKLPGVTDGSRGGRSTAPRVQAAAKTNPLPPTPGHPLTQRDPLQPWSSVKGVGGLRPPAAHHTLREQPHAGAQPPTPPNTGDPPPSHRGGGGGCRYLSPAAGRSPPPC